MSKKNSSLKYTAADQMIVSASHLIQDREAVYTGRGLPLLAALLAMNTHAPHCTIILENGILQSREFALPIGADSLECQFGADQLANLNYINYLGQAGFINLGFMGAGQIDRYGNVNDTLIGDYADPVYRFPGGGGGPDVMTFCRQTCVVVRQSRRRFPEKVDFITCPGFLDGKPGRREDLGISPGTGPAAVITDLGCYGFEHGEMVLKTIHTGCGINLKKIKAETGWDLKISPDLKDTLPPTVEELRLLHEKVDPEGRWAGGKRAAVTLE